MNRLLAASLALNLLCGSAFAANVGYKLPITGVLLAQAPLQAQVIAQIQALNQLPGPLALGPSALTPSLPSAPISPEAAAVVRGFLSQPQLLKTHGAELAKAIGAENVSALAALVQSGNAAAAASLLGAGPSINPSDPASVSKLGALFDGSSGAATASAAPVAAAAPAGKAKLPRSWKLSKAQKIHRSAPGEEAQAMESLKKSLEIMELPPYVERTETREISEPLVAWAGLPSIWKLSIFREGGRQAPGDVNYMLDASWFIQVPGADGKNHLYATKGLHFEKDGTQAVLVTYKHPRRVRYFGNWLTMGAFDTAQGVPLEKDLDTPMSSSSRLEKVTNDKLWTRLLMAANGSNVPASRAFLLPDHVFLARGGKLPGTERNKAVRMPLQRGGVEQHVRSFLKSYQGAEVVVKPSGPRFHSGEGVAFFDRSNIAGIVDHVIALSQHPSITSSDSVLLEQRLAPPPVYLRLSEYSGSGRFVYRDKKKWGVTVLAPDQIASAEPHERKDSNERVYAVRGADGRPVMIPQSFFRAGTWGKPTSGQPKDPRDAAAIVSFHTMREALVAQHGILYTDAEVAELRADVETLVTRGLQAIMDNEKALAREAGEPYQAQTDMVGFDIMYQLEKVGGKMKLVPYAIEVNDHDAAGQHVLDLFHPDQVGLHSTELVRTWLARAAQDAKNNP